MVLLRVVLSSLPIQFQAVLLPTCREAILYCSKFSTSMDFP